jgi:hypothetical protein
VKKASWSSLIRVAFIFLLVASFLLGVIVQKKLNLKSISTSSTISDGNLRGKCPYWGLWYTSETSIPSELLKNSVGRLDIMSGQITKISENGQWQVRTPLINTGAVIDKNTYIEGNRTYNVGDCITFAGDMKRTLVVFPQD